MASHFGKVGLEPRHLSIGLPEEVYVGQSSCGSRITARADDQCVPTPDTMVSFAGEGVRRTQVQAGS